MKTGKMTRTAVACAAACASATLCAADIAVGQWARQAIDDDTPAIGAGEGLYLCEDAASLSYVGTNAAWTLPLGNVFAFGHAEIGVRNGTLRIANSSAPDLVANPPAELQKAALWLDATKNVETATINGNICAINWYDAREPSAAATTYGYAVASDTTGGGPLLESANGCVYFRIYSKDNVNKSFLYKAADGTATAYDIRHAFFVQSPVTNNIGAQVLGHTTATNFLSTLDEETMLINTGKADPLAYSCEFLLDGVHSDPTLKMPRGRRYLCEFTLPRNRTIAVDSLVRDRDKNSGGRRIHEILLFTQPLTVQERLRITAYLMARWSCGGTSSLNVNTAAGTAVQLVDGTSLDTVVATGSGTLIVGSGAHCEALHRYADAGKVRAPYALQDGTSSLALQATEYEYRLSSQDRLTVNCATNLSTLTKDALGAPGSAAVTSARQFVVSELDPAITNLTLSGGGNLVLRARRATSSGYVAGTAANTTFGATSLSVPAGKTNPADTTVVVPADGDWEIAFNMSNNVVVADNYGNNLAAYKVQLMSGGSVVWEKLPTVLSPSAYNGAEQSRRYLVRNLQAGTYTFRVVGCSSETRAASLSDLSMVFVPNKVNETVVPITDGDFESLRIRRPFFAAAGNTSADYIDWTIAYDESRYVGYNPPVLGPVTSAMGYNEPPSYGASFIFRSALLGRYGDNALVWFHNKAKVTSPATVLPAGTYKLRFDAVRWTTGKRNHGSLLYDTACDVSATLTASVSVNGGEPVTLGEIGPITNFVVASLSFPASFTASEDDSVTVSLRQNTTFAAVQIDNLEFVKVEDAAPAALGEELVVDGGCASDTSEAWHFDDWRDGTRHVAQIRSPIGGDTYGTTKCEGDYVFRSANGGRAYQTIVFPAGVFRLSWWSRARIDGGKATYRTPIFFWHVAEGSSETNEIVTSELSWCTNFTEHVAYFSVPVAGSYVFGFNSKEVNGSDVLVDCVSVRQVLGAEATPDIPESAEIAVSGGGKLRLDYNGCLSLARVSVNGVKLNGEVSAATFPDYVCGPGRVFVKPKGFIVIFK